MLNSFIIVMREGFESFLLVAVILAYLRKSGQRWLNMPVYVAIAVALAASGGIAYLLNTGVEEGTVNTHVWRDDSAGMSTSSLRTRRCVRRCLAPWPW